MKRRNQLVSALLTGVLLGGSATAASVTPIYVAAEESSMQSMSTDASQEEKKKKESSSDSSAGDSETAQPEADAGQEAGASEAEAAEEPASYDAEGAEQSAASEGDYPYAEDESLPESFSDMAEDGQTPLPEDEKKDVSGGVSASEGTEISAEGVSSGDSGNTDKTALSQAEETPEGETQEGETLPAGEDKQEEADTEVPEHQEDGSGDSFDSAKDVSGEPAAQTPQKETSGPTKKLTPYKTPEQTAADEIADQMAARKAAELERKRKEKEQTKTAAEEDAVREKKEKEAELKAQAARRYGYAASNRVFYSGNYFVTNAQRRLALNIGFTRIEKTPAMAAGSGTVQILEAKNEGARVLGLMDSKDVCYILADAEDSSGWAYVESGEVRGFAQLSALKSGSEVESYVEMAGDGGISTAQQLVDPLENAVYRYSLNTTKDVPSIIQALGTAAVNRQAMISFAEQFVGNPYVWGGESLTAGCDCSGFTQQVYAQFGISLPRTSYEQAEVGIKIPAEEALPGDLLFYARDGVVYHVLMYVGDGKAVNASSSATGIIVQDVDYSKVCWGCRYISESGAQQVIAPELSSTQASSLQAIGQMAFEGDASAQQVIIEALAQASMKEWKTYGFCRSVIIAQAIEESGWLSFGSSQAGIQSTDNNILGMNEALNNSTWASPWSGKAATRLVPQYASGGNVYNFESMRLYEDMESCMEDYAAFKVGLHPDLIGETDVNHVIAVGLEGYATNPNYQSNVRDLIDRYNLTRFDQEETAALRPAPIPETLPEEEPADLPDVESEIDELEEEISEAAEDAADQADISDEDYEFMIEAVPDSALPEEDAEETDGQDTIEDDTDDLGFVENEADGLEENIQSELDNLKIDLVVVPSELEDGEEIPPQVENSQDVSSQVENPKDVSLQVENPQDVSPQVESPQETPSQVENPQQTSDAAASSQAEAVNPDQEEPAGEDAAAAVSEDTETEAPENPASEARSASGIRLDVTEYTEKQLELIWAVVAQEDDTSYDGALAVISSVMNRADVNYGGFGTTAFDQLTAESQYACSADVEDPLYYERRLDGNVPDFVKQAVKDCLEQGIRNHSYISFRSDNYVEGSVQIGANYYYYETAADAAEAISNMADVIGEIPEEVPGEALPDGVYSDGTEMEVPEAHYLFVEDMPETMEEEAPEAAVWIEEEPETVSYEGLDENGFVILEAVPDSEL